MNEKPKRAIFKELYEFNKQVSFRRSAGRRLNESVVIPMMEMYPMKHLYMICDPSTRRLGAMIKRQLAKRLPINYPEEQ